MIGPFRVTGSDGSDVTYRPSWMIGPWDALAAMRAMEPNAHPDDNGLADAIDDCPRLAPDLRRQVAARFRREVRGRPAAGCSPQALASKLRATSEGDETMTYVAGRLDGSVPLPPGRPAYQLAARLRKYAWVTALEYEVRVIAVALRIQGCRRPKGRAVEIVATRVHIEPETLHRYRTRWGTRSWKDESITESTIRRAIRAAVAAGAFRLNPDTGLSPSPGIAGDGEHLRQSPEAWRLHETVMRPV